MRILVVVAPLAAVGCATVGATADDPTVEPTTASRPPAARLVSRRRLVWDPANGTVRCVGLDATLRVPPEHRAAVDAVSSDEVRVVVLGGATDAGAAPSTALLVRAARAAPDAQQALGDVADAVALVAPEARAWRDPRVELELDTAGRHGVHLRLHDGDGAQPGAPAPITLRVVYTVLAARDRAARFVAVEREPGPVRSALAASLDTLRGAGADSALQLLLGLLRAGDRPAPGAAPTAPWLRAVPPAADPPRPSG